MLCLDFKFEKNDLNVCNLSQNTRQFIKIRLMLISPLIEQTERRKRLYGHDQHVNSLNPKELN